MKQHSLFTTSKEFNHAEAQITILTSYPDGFEITFTNKGVNFLKPFIYKENLEETAQLVIEHQFKINLLSTAN